MTYKLSYKKLGDRYCQFHSEKKVEWLNERSSLNVTQMKSATHFIKKKKKIISRNFSANTV